MEVTYRIVVLAADGDLRVGELTSATQAAVEAAGITRVRLDVVAGDPPDEPTTPTVAVYLGSPAARADAGLDERLAAVLEAGSFVLPVMTSYESFSEEIPDRMRYVNGQRWHPDRVADVLLRELGLHEDRREVFISHKRSESVSVAEQLHTHLERRRFRVFVDRFDLEPGSMVQAEILDAICETGFFLLLETPRAHRSRWVRKEVVHAEANRIPRLILRWPDVAGGASRAIDDLTERVVLDDAELEPDGSERPRRLTASAVERIGDLIERGHAAGLARRRAQLVGSVLDHLDVLGIEADELPGWRFQLDLATPHRLGIGPRPPRLADLYRLYQDAPDCSYIYGSSPIRPDVAAMLTWAVGDRNVTPVPVERAAEHLAALGAGAGR